MDFKLFKTAFHLCSSFLITINQYILSMCTLILNFVTFGHVCSAFLISMYTLILNYVTPGHVCSSFLITISTFSPLTTHHSHMLIDFKLCYTWPRVQFISDHVQYILTTHHICSLILNFVTSGHVCSSCLTAK